MFTDTLNYHDVLAQYTGSRGQLYLDNKIVINASRTTDLILTGLKTIISAYVNEFRLFNGQISRCIIWNREILPHEVQQLSNLPDDVYLRGNSILFFSHVAAIFDELITEGIIASDSEASALIVKEAITEALIAGDTINNLMLYGESTIEIALASDLSIDPRNVEGPIKITISTKQSKFTNSVKQSKISTSVKQSKFTIEIQ